MSRTLDHGVLNTPIGSRARGGSIDAQIDRWKREQAREERTAARQTRATVREQKSRVSELLDRMGDYRIMALAKPLGARKPSTARAALYQAAQSNLHRWIKVLEREAIPAGGCATCWAPVGQCDHDGREWLGAGE